MENRRKNLDLLQGPIGKTFILLAIPVLLAMFMQTFFNIVDTYFVSRLGTDAIAAMGLTFPIFMLSISLGSGVSIGISSLVARSIGAGEEEKSFLAAGNGLLLAAAIGVFFFVFGIAIVDPMLRFIGAEGEVFRMAKSYIIIVTIAMPIKFLLAAVDGIFRGEGKTRLSMIALVSGSVVNIVLDPLLIFGIGPFPRLEVAGAAIATAIAWGVGLSIGILFIIKNKSSINLKAHHFRYKWEYIKNILVVGLPSSVAQGAIAFTMVFINRFAMDFSEEAVAAYALGFRIDSIAILPGVAFAGATIAMLGQNYGAKNYHRVEGIYRKATVFGMLVMGGIALLVFAFPDPLLMIFLEESGTGASEVLRQGRSYLRIMALSYVFIGMGMVSNASFQAVGRGMPTFITTAIRFFILAIPLSYTLAYLFRLETIGIWLGLSISNVFFGFVSRYWFLYSFSKGYTPTKEYE
ncbi:putative efflux protein, MATE family [Natronincola peptidivorans]|uniref:Putative efflux protein, MATE family n=1 Tax=Natronincola peptidivorans TaxID=426128 RepID=A0A1I0AUT5_9FIRM|nr:MATE family efflux transporter [Natronincola peptidivorans]SES98144.1 putative efflux protein, MATE family [Natronincola peptidivorans]